MTQLTDIWRHPIKAHGREALQQVTLEPGKTMPWDRVWAVAHDAAKVNIDAPEWARCGNFARAAKAPLLNAMTSRMHDETGQVTCHHPDIGEITVDLTKTDDAARFVDWVRPLNPPDRAQPSHIFSVPDRGLTDSDFPSVSIANHASRRDMGQKMGAEVSALRFRCNLWLDDGLAAWGEFDLTDREFSIGSVVFRGVAPIERCNATKANPETGAVDLDTLAALNSNWGHQNFGLNATVIRGGTIAVGDMLVS